MPNSNPSFYLRHRRSSCTSFALLAVVLLFGTLGLANAWPPDPAIPGSLGVQLKGGGDDAATLDKIKELGVKWVRRGFNWEAIEKQKGAYDFSKYDQFMRDCKARGLSVVGCMAFSNKLYGGHAKDEPGRSGYAKFAAALAAQYKDYDIVWEIWNEPNTMTFWGKHGPKGNSEPYAAEYFGLVQATAPAMLKANPKAIIAGGSVSNMWTESYKWMDFIFKKGVLKTGINVWSVHPYGVKSPEDYLIAYAHMRGQMAAAGGPANIAVANTERGFPLGKAEGYAGGDPALSYEYQAWHLVRQYLIDLLENVQPTIWYEWAGKEGFALYRPGEPIPAYKACKVLIDQLRGYHLEKRIEVGAPRDFVLRFVNPAGAAKLVAWTAPPEGQPPDKAVPHVVKIPVTAMSGASLQTAQLLGEPGTLPVKMGVVEVNLTGAPQYIAAK